MTEVQKDIERFFRDSVEVFCQDYLEEWVLSHSLSEEGSKCDFNIAGGEVEAIINDPEDDPTGTIYTFIYNSEADKVLVYETTWRFVAPGENLQIKKIPVRTAEISECFWRHVTSNLGSISIYQGLKAVLRDNEEIKTDA